MDIKTIEYLVFFGLLILMLLFFFIYQPNKANTYYDDIWKCESPIERRVYRGLLQHNLSPTPQHRVGKYRIDLAFPQSMLAIECDGKAYHSTPTQKAHDRKKDKFLSNRGWTVLRFSGSKIHRNLPEVVQKIKENL